MLFIAFLSIFRLQLHTNLSYEEFQNCRFTNNAHWCQFCSAIDAASRMCGRLSFIIDKRTFLDMIDFWTWIVCASININKNNDIISCHTI